VRRAQYGLLSHPRRGAFLGPRRKHVPIDARLRRIQSPAVWHPVHNDILHRTPDERQAIGRVQTALAPEFTSDLEALQKMAHRADPGDLASMRVPEHRPACRCLGHGRFTVAAPQPGRPALPRLADPQPPSPGAIARRQRELAVGDRERMGSASLVIVDVDLIVDPEC
jgi:hypothetical protein